MADEIRDAILNTATGPSKVQTDAGLVESQPIQDQIAADRYLSGKIATSKKGRGLRFSKLIPPGSTGYSPTSDS